MEEPNYWIMAYGIIHTIPFGFRISHSSKKWRRYLCIFCWRCGYVKSDEALLYESEEREFRKRIKMVSIRKCRREDRI